MPLTSDRPVIWYTRHRWIKPAVCGAGVLLSLLCAVVVTTITFRQLAGRPFAAVLLPLAAGSVLIGPAMLIHLLTTRYRPYRGYLWWVAGVVAAGAVAHTYILVQGTAGIGAWPALGLAVVVSILLLPAEHRYVRHQVQDQLTRMTLLAPGGDMALVLADIAAVGRRTLPPQRRNALAVAEARTLVAGSAGEVGARDLLRAVETLARVVDEPSSNPLILVVAADELVQAFDQRLLKHGDATGCHEALQILSRAAREVSHVPGTTALVKGRWGAFHKAMMWEAPPGEVDPDLAQQAEWHLRAAIAATPDGDRIQLAGLHLQYAGVLDGAYPERRDEAIGHCATAYPAAAAPATPAGRGGGAAIGALANLDPLGDRVRIHSTLLASNLTKEERDILLETFGDA